MRKLLSPLLLSLLNHSNYNRLALKYILLG